MSEAVKEKRVILKNAIKFYRANIRDIRNRRRELLQDYRRNLIKVNSLKEELKELEKECSP